MEKKYWMGYRDTKPFKTIWKNSLDNIEKIEIPCWYGFIPNPENLIELHIFADSFSKVYGAVSYL